MDRLMEDADNLLRGLCRFISEYHWNIPAFIERETSRHDDGSPCLPPDNTDTSSAPGDELSPQQSSAELETELMWSQVSLSIEQAELRRLRRFELVMLTPEQVSRYEELFSRGDWELGDPDNLSWLIYKRASLVHNFEQPTTLTTFLRPEHTHVGNLLQIAEYQM